VSGVRDRVLAVARVVFGAMWLVAAVAKIAKPTAAFQLVSRVAPPGVSPKLLLAAAIAAETYLGASMCLRAVRGFGWSLAGIAVASGALLAVRWQMGNSFPCGCFGMLLGTTVDEALLRNAAVAAVHVALLVWGRRAAIMDARAT
jgi:hypothetical protein